MVFFKMVEICDVENAVKNGASIEKFTTVFPRAFLRRHKFPLGCDGHVSKFPIQSLLLSMMEEFYDVAKP